MLNVAVKFVKDTLYPIKCLACRNEVLEDYGLCCECFKNIDQKVKPICEICSDYLSVIQSFDKICETCEKDPPKFDKAICIFGYNHVVKRLVHNYKYHDQTNYAPYFAHLMNLKIKALGYDNFDYIASVPLHQFKLLRRGYNQAALIGYYLSKLSQIKLENRMLLRTEFTRPQAGLSRHERKKNVQNVFAINPKLEFDIKNKKILLIDDIITTGATSRSCSSVLKKAGANEVCVISIARVLL